MRLAALFGAGYGAGQLLGSCKDKEAWEKGWEWRKGIARNKDDEGWEEAER